jgi:hypothetical protein
MKKLILYISNDNILLCKQNKKIFLDLTIDGNFPISLNGRNSICDKLDFEDFYLKKISENLDTPVIIRFLENFSCIGNQISFMDRLCSCVLSERTAPIYIFTHSETILNMAIEQTILDELNIIWLYESESGGTHKEYTMTTKDIKDVLNENINIWLNMRRYLPEEDLPKFD